MVENRIKLNVADAYLLSNGLIYLKFKHDQTINVQDRIDLAQAIEDLAAGQKRKVLIQTGERSSITPEARKLDINKRVESYVIKEALIITTLSVRISATFYYKFRKPKFPFKVFAKYDEALEWLDVEADDLEKLKAL
jgi:hypothetical protein